MSTHLDWPIAAHDLGVDEEYDRYAPVYDLVFAAQGDDLAFYAGVAAETAGVGGSLLELGTGTGRVGEYLVNAGFLVVGVDFSRAMLAHAERRSETLGGRYTAVEGDVRSVKLERHFSLVIAPFGMMAHFIDDTDRLATMRVAFDHLEPGGELVFDDMPSWLAGNSAGDRLMHLRTVKDPSSHADIRVQVTMVDIADQPLTLCFHFIDWIAPNGGLLRRVAIRVLFRNANLEEDIALLQKAGFTDIRVQGGFDGRAFDRERLANNSRLVLRCRKPR